MSIQQIFLSLGAQRFDPLVAFYQQVFDHPPPLLKPGVYAEFHLAGLRFALYTVPNATPTPAPSLSHDSPGLGICLQVADLELVLERVQTAIAHYPHPCIAAIGAILTPSHGREVHILDPEGNRFILYQPQGYSSTTDESMV